MNFDPSLATDSRRDFVKKSLAASIIAAQPTILAGLIRAQGGGGGTGTTNPWGTTDPSGSTVQDTTDSFYTTDPETTEPDETTEFWDVVGEALGPDGPDEDVEPDAIALDDQPPVGNPPYTGEGEEPPRQYGEAPPVSVGPGYKFKAKFWAIEKTHDAKVKLQVAGEIYKHSDGSNVATTEGNGIVGEIVNQITGELDASADPEELGSARVTPPQPIEEIDTASNGDQVRFQWYLKIFLGAPGVQPQEGLPVLTQPDIHNAYLKGNVYCEIECVKSEKAANEEEWTVVDFDEFDDIEMIPFTLHLKSCHHADEE